MKYKSLQSFCVAVFGAVTCQSFAQTVPTAQPDRSVIPLAEPEFEGVIGKTYKESTSAWPRLQVPPAGATHAPHHPPKEWSDKFKGQFDQGWEKVREETNARQLKNGIIPPDTKLTPRPEWVPAWDTLSADLKKLYLRLFENYAGYLAFADHECGRLIDAVNQLPDADNTMVIHIVGDNGASSEGGPDGTLNDVKALNGFPTPIGDNLKLLDTIGGPETEPHCPVGWAWSGNAPFQWVKQVASHLGGSRNPMIVTWPARIKDKGGIRTRFTYHPGAVRLAETAAPNSKNRSHTRVEIT